MNIYLSNNIKYLRKSRGWTQEDFGNEVGKTNAAVRAWEKSINTPPVEMVIQISQIFNIGVEDLLFSNLEIESYKELEGPAKTGDEIQDELIELLRFKIEAYEEKIKIHAPELAKMLGLG